MQHIDGFLATVPHSLARCRATCHMPGLRPGTGTEGRITVGTQRGRSKEGQKTDSETGKKRGNVKVNRLK
jgi:hypothetical protein